MKRLWGGVEGKTAERTVRYCSAWDATPKPPYDWILLPFDILASKAHCKMLSKQKVISRSECAKLVAALSKLERRIPESFLEGFEDAHTALEFYLVRKCGQAGLKIHAGRSRNDQCAVALLLAERHYARQLKKNIGVLAAAMRKKARHAGEAPLLGFTHHQPAMPTTWKNFFLSYAVQLERVSRLIDAFLDIYSYSPLGAAAGFSTSIPIDKHNTARALGFSKPFENEIDAVGSRWEADSFLAYCICLCMNSLSSLSQSLLIFSTPQFGYLMLSREFVTGSSMMPQKRNPDILEITKAKAISCQASLAEALAIGKSLFVGYNRELQYSKYAVLDALNEATDAPLLFAELLSRGLEIDFEKTASEAHKYGVDSTLKAEKIALKKKIPFRKAKRIIERDFR